jgi:hypothetical protein
LSDESTLIGILLTIIYVLYTILYIVQTFLAYGIAYRKTKANGDNGVSLFGWMIVYQFAALIPFLSIFQWKKSKQEGFK